MKQPAIFLDRDGVIIENRDHHVLSWSDVVFLPGVLDAIALLSRRSSHRLVIVTNQSAVGLGLLTLETAELINQRIVNLIREGGGRIDGVYMCPHKPANRCDCRKPGTGLFLQAAEELGLDLARSVMIGDALTDIEAARAAGLANAYLVRTGRGSQQEQLPSAARFHPLPVYDSLVELAANLMITPLP